MRTKFVVDLLDPNSGDMISLTREYNLDFMPRRDDAFQLCSNWDPMESDENNPPVYRLAEHCAEIVFKIFFPRAVIDERIAELVSAGFVLETD